MPKKIVLIDDDPLIRALVCEVLGPSYTMLCAEDGLVGLEIVAREVPDLVICDFAMPRMHGFEVCRKIRETPALKNIKILMSSSKSYAQDIVNAKAAGADDYLVKPFSLDDLVRKVEGLAGR